MRQHLPVVPANGRQSTREQLILDTGCTAESIVNKEFADSLGLPITPTNVQSATLGDGETAMTILGEIAIKTNFMGNLIDIRAVVTEESEGVLLGMPGIENCCIDIISSKKELRFPNSAVLNYRTGVQSRAIATSSADTVSVRESRIICRRALLQAPPTSTWLNPGESITLTTKIDNPTCDGKYLIAPHPEAKGSTQDWISTSTHEIKDGSVTITNDCAIIQMWPNHSLF